MAVKIGPVAAKFNGKIALADINPPASYSLNFEGQGGAAGFGKGRAEVLLKPLDRGCELSYKAQASVGGKIAQVGQRLIDGVAKAMAEDFFKRFDAEMQRLHPQAYAEPQAPVAEAASAKADGGGLPGGVWPWVAAAVVALAAFWLLK